MAHKRIKTAKIFTILLATVTLTLLIGGIFFTTHRLVAAGNTHKQISPLATPSQEPSPTPSPTPTPSPSPSVEPLSGFCLRVPTLLYHHIEPLDQTKQGGHASLAVDNNTFDLQMSYLAQNGYNTLSADQLAEALIGHQKLPAKSIVLTFDDAYQDFYDYAYPIIQKYHLSANLMVPTGLLDNPGYLRWDQLREVASSGLVYAYDHTYSHTALTSVSADKIQFEISIPKKQLEEKLGKPINIFAYPYGSESSVVINLLKSTGFIAAFSTIPGFTQCDSFIMSLHRNRIGNSPLSSYGL